MSQLIFVLFFLVLLSGSADSATFEGSAVVVSPPVYSSNGATINQSTAVAVRPPAGSAPTMSQSTAAATVAGTMLAAGAMSQQYPVTGQLAMNLATQLLGAGAAAAVGGPIGVAMAAAQLAQAGATGAALYDALKSKGITPSANGSLLVSNSPPILACSGWSYVRCISASEIPGVANGYSCPSGWNLLIGFPGGIVSPYTGYGMGCGDSGGAVLPGSSVPANGTDINNALGALLTPGNPNFNALAGDIAALGIQAGLDIGAGLRNSDAGAQGSGSGTSLASPFVVTGTKTDSAGNTTSTLSRNELTLPPNSAGTPPAPVVTTRDISIVNNSPVTNTTTVNNSSTSQVAGSPVVLTAQQQATDLCAQHPDALACSNDAGEGDVAAQPLKTKDLAVSLTPVSVSSLAMCPGPVAVGFGKFFDFSGICAWLMMLKPLLLAFAWLSAGAIVFRGRPYA